MMKKIIFLIIPIFILASCSGGDDNNSGDDYNRTELLTNWADNLIIPRYDDYQSKVNALHTNTATFTSNPDQTNLDALRTSWLEAYKAYQYVGAFNIGKAEEINLNSATNIYPTNVIGIESNITNGGYNFALLSQYDKQGFPAIDYLINGLANNDTEIIDFYVSNTNATGYKQYLTDLSSQLKANIDLVVADWNGAYRNTFISSNGNSVSSSVNKMVNNFIKYYEKDIRLGKVGYPSGAFLNDGVKFPEKVEAYYKNDISKILLNDAIIATQDFFNGKHFNSTTEGASLKSYLNYLGTIRDDNQSLSTVISNQFDTIKVLNSSLNDSFSTQINSDNNAMIEIYDALQRNVVYFKIDMITALNITVDYVDNDGD